MANLPADLVSRLLDADMGDDNITQALLVEAATEIRTLRELLSTAQDRNAEHCAEVQRLRAAMQEIASYPPGTLRPLADEIAIYKLATEALGLQSTRG